MPVDAALIQEALAAFGVTEVRALRDGGQKTVRLVDRAGEELVLKVISVGSSSPEALRRAQREVELLQQIDDDHVVRVASNLIELGTPTSGAAWLEEYLVGEDLSAIVGRPWDWADAFVLGRDVSLGLGAMHAVSVVHRDLSANNVRRVVGPRYVVMDPGFARHTLRSDLTVGGQPGTAGFLSPEHLQAYSGAPTAASDVFGVGILMYLALTGNVPIAYLGDAADYITRLSAVEVADLHGLRPDLSDEAVALVHRCLHPQSSRRPKNGTRLATELEAIP